MSDRTPNHRCKTCGEEYYACNDCDKLNSWRAVACCIDHYVAYCERVEKARAAELDPKNKIPEQIESQSEEIEDIDE